MSVVVQSSRRRSAWAPLILLVAVILTAAVRPAAAAGKGGDMKPFGEITKDTEHLTGFFDVYRDKETVYLEIPVDRLQAPFLFIPTLSRGIGSYGLLGGTSLNIFAAQMMRFERRGDRLLLIDMNQQFRAPEGTPYAAAVDLSYGNSVLASLDIVSERHEGDEIGVVPEKKDKKKDDDKKDDAAKGEDAKGDDAKAGDASGDKSGEDTASADKSDDKSADQDKEDAKKEEEEPKKPVVSVVIKFTDYLMTDIPNLTQEINDSIDGAGFSLAKDLSSFESVKVFPDNAEFEVNLVFKSSGKQYVETLGDSRSLPLGLHYSFSRLPEHPMMPRLADDRIGYFMTTHEDFSRDQDRDYYVSYINHWRLEKKNPNRDVSDPVKPIVFYIENTVPQEYRKYIKQGVELWQAAFEAAGFSNAILCKEQLDDPDFDPEDVRYSTIRWITSHRPSYGAIGPSRVDPRTGETLDADILIEGDMVQGFRSSWRGYVGLGADENEFPWEHVEKAETQAFLEAMSSPGGINSGLYCGLASGFMESGALLQSALMARGTIKPGEPVPEEFVGQALVWVVVHEVGHTLGLRHNFRASRACPFDKLNDTSWTHKNGLYASVMDYATPNISPDPKKQGDYFTAAVGTYDTWAIRYGYAPVKGAKTPEDELPALMAVASQSSDPLHSYGTDEDAYLPGSTDPFTNTFDLSDDVLAFCEERAGFLSTLWDTPYDDRVLANGEPWSDFTSNYAALLGQYYRTMSLVTRYIGGEVTSRAHKGDPGGELPFTAVDADRQHRALSLLAGEVFSEKPFDMPPQFYQKLGSNNLNHWGVSVHRNGRRDFPYKDAVLSVQRGILSRLVNPWTLGKIADSELQTGGAFTMVDLFGTLNASIWSEIGVSADGHAAGAGGASTEQRNISAVRRGLQRDWLARLSGIALNQDDGPMADARSVARMTLADLQTRLDAALERSDTLDGYTRAHLMESRDTVKRVLEVGLTQTTRGE